MTGLTLSRDERLRSPKDIDLLFAQGKRLAKYPILMVFLPVQNPEYPPIRVLFSVSKKKFRKAVDRNRIKRLMREAFRLQKAKWISLLPDEQRFHFAFVFTGNELPALNTIQRSLDVLQSKWKEQESPK